MFRIGFDIGSTTAKMVVLDENGNIVFSKYERHNAKVKETVISFLKELLSQVGDEEISIRITGSIGMGVSETCAISFVQEVVAAAKAIQKDYPAMASMIDIGGEDAKVVFFKDGEPTDLRMNGNCAGGTGAFIDQMAIILGVDINELNALAMHADQVYPIASRCGVFCKTDIQNLIAKNVSRENIAASIFHAVAVQTVITLAHGYDIKVPVLFCGGPLTFIPALRKAFINYLSLDEKDVILPDHGTLLPALGTALSNTDQDECYKLSHLLEKIDKSLGTSSHASTDLKAIFENETEYTAWKNRMAGNKIKKAEMKAGEQDVFIGIDSGSTTTKIVVIDTDSRLLYSYYNNNGGNAIKTVEEGLNELYETCRKRGAILHIKGSCSTGYGEDLIKSAFQLHSGIIETIAHYMAAQYLDKQVSFILDIGGQDMKAIFVNKGVIDRIEINEACSSGCGSFIETFARSLGYTVSDFSLAACRSSVPSNLGTRCTVFMNSKVKQELRDGATVNDIAAGLAYSVVKNCLYKVLKLKDISTLGKNIVVQGGTMRNDAIVRALEILTGAEVSRCDKPELMGAFGCALYAMQHQGVSIRLDEIIAKAQYTSRFLRCKGCDNQCLVTCYQFGNGKKYYSGNRCEKVFTNGENNGCKGENVYHQKNELLFNRNTEIIHPRMTIGIPRCLNMYEEYPFWHTLFTACDIQVCLSDVSNFLSYENSARMVMSDNICFPAKLVHSHINNLLQKKVDRIFMPFVVFEKKDKEQNSYNCPIVSGYSEVIKSVDSGCVPIDSPVITFKDRKLLFKQCRDFLIGLNVDINTIRTAFKKAEYEQAAFEKEIVSYNEKVLQDIGKNKTLTVMLAGRPYHSDPLIQHKISDMIAEMGVHVITDDLVRDKEVGIDDIHFVAQWAYTNRILKAAKWCATQGKEIQFIEMTSFGCGPDAFLVDEVREVLMRHNKSLTLLKLDDISNIGSMKLRVRSMIESLKLIDEHPAETPDIKDFVTVPIYDQTYRNRKILVPFFTPFMSPLIPSILKVAGYDVENLPLSNSESCEWGLKYANNEVCYPATLIVGDIIKAFKSKKYDPAKTAVAITQTGGQCRASNYISLIKKALIDAGYTDVPVISISFGGGIENNQPGFSVNWLKILPVAFYSILYSDCIAKFYYGSVVREKEKGISARLRDQYLELAAEAIGRRDTKQLLLLLQSAADEFNAACMDCDAPKIGVVGEIFLKFNPFAQKNLIDWLIEKGVEVVPPILSNFFMQSFVNRKVNVEAHVENRQLSDLVLNGGYRIARKQINKINAIAARFRYFVPFGDIFEEAEETKKLVSLHAQFGEGWLLPAEIVAFAREGVNNVVSLQPFGCIANHIVAKGIEKRVRNFYPDINFLSLDFDSGVSEVNIVNRMLLFMDNLKK
ncbi:2-hydroxyglutaryl-CoA dehydratase [Bacteroides salyersiae]|uniref:acyl-CoA dehydratase activase n=1 Tax=Bacteroides salyersiae TaxID=291644 RepID=UPI001C027D65|nr:acyl-CoA dehydratase activase-related protein [Bacteroides salyersiae]MBT9873891.1 2-hydroxyglutaryl-CoA dehydratase [Bacteroides salyersiae]